MHGWFPRAVATAGDTPGFGVLSRTPCKSGVVPQSAELQFTPDDVGNVLRATANIPLSRSLRRFGILSHAMFLMPKPSTPISTTCFTGVHWEGRTLSRPPKPPPNAAAANAAQQPAASNALLIVKSPLLYGSMRETTRKPTFS
jgi:hypothetical protein